MNKESKTILEVKNLKKFFHNKFGIVNAVDNVEFSVKEGEIVGLIGESGSGKTTVGRSLIRLYDDYSGVVILNGKPISGKRISRKKEKFLRKNMQMIFQDPHASLNGQKNIFSILKEPLVVNGILKQELKDVLKDLSLVQQNFYYTFRDKFNDTKLENFEFKYESAKKALGSWEEKLEKLTFSPEEKFDDLFNSYFNFYESNYSIQSLVINNEYRNYYKLYNFYFEKQKDYRNKVNIDQDEIELATIREQIELYNKYHKKSEDYYKAKELYDKNKKLLGEFKKSFATKKENAVNMIKSYINEFFLEYKLANSKAWDATSNEEWSYYKLIATVNKISYKLLKVSFFKNLLNTNLLFFLKFNEVRFLIEQIKKYNEDFIYKFNLPKTFSKGFEKKLVLEIYDAYKFKIDKYLQRAQEHKNLYLKEKADFENRKAQSKKSFAFNSENNKDFLPTIQKLKDEYEKAKKIFDQGVEKFNIEFNSRQEKRDKRLKELESLWQEEILDVQKRIKAIFAKKHTEFLNFVKDQLSQKGKDKKEINLIVSQYDNILKEKEKNFNNFEKEIMVIQRGYENIKILYGIESDNKFFKYYNKVFYPQIIKKVILQEKIYKALEDVGLLKQFAYRYPHEFSGGQRQRIVIARALIVDPKLIIADEPIASLDISIQAQIVNLLKELGKEKNIGIVFIAHDLSMVEYIADKILIMHLGKIVERGKTEKIYENPIHKYTINLFNSIPKMANANEPFKKSNFDISYLDEQKFPNKISYFDVEDQHQVLATAKQFQEWVKAK